MKVKTSTKAGAMQRPYDYESECYASLAGICAGLVIAWVCAG